MIQPSGQSDAGRNFAPICVVSHYDERQCPLRDSRCSMIRPAR